MDSVKKDQVNYYESSVKADEIDIRKRKLRWFMRPGRPIHFISGAVTGITFLILNHYFGLISWFLGLFS